MKSVSARDNRAPAPRSSANLAPDIFVARSNSRMPRAGPRSQCARGSKSNVVGSPHVRTTTLSASLLPDGDAGVRDVRQRHQDDRALLFDLIELDAELAYLLRALPVRLEDTARVLPLTLGPRHFVAGRILIALQTFELRNQPASPVFERRELLEVALDVPAAVLQPAPDFFLVIAYVCRVKHGEIVCYGPPPTACRCAKVE